MAVSVTRAWHLLLKDLRLGPRSPIVLWALVVPVVLTLLVQLVFGDLFDGEPSLGIVDEGASALVELARALDGIDVRVLDDPDALRAQVEDGALDAGLVLPAGFDDAVRSGQRPTLPLWLAGESLPSARAVILSALVDLVAQITDDPAPATIEVVRLGEETLPIDLRVLPLLVMYAVAIPGGMVPASSLVEEKEHGTLQALLVSPMSVAEVLVAKGVLGVMLAMLAGLVTLGLNDAFGASPVAVVLAVALGAVMMSELGLIMGSWAPDTNTMFAAWKAGGLVIFLPVFFFIWPELPQWPARIIPTYYFLHPAYSTSVEGASLGAVAGELAIAAAVCAVLVPLVVVAGHRMEVRLAGGRLQVSAPDDADGR